MAITVSLGFDPFWYIADNVGLPLAGGSLATWSSLNPDALKYVYRDPDGLNPWPNPIIFDENGQQGPFYFKYDSATPTDNYFLEVRDAQGNLVWTFDDYIASGGGGGGGGGTSAYNVNNLIINGVFWRNIGSTPSPIANMVTTVAPGCHAGLALTANNAGPDILFLKNNLTATDQITFPPITQGTQPLVTGGITDPAPVQYFNYSCTGPGSGETQKCLQIPIIAKVQNLTKIAVSVTVWGMSSTSSSIVMQWLTYLGDGA